MELEYRDSMMPPWVAGDAEGQRRARAAFARNEHAAIREWERRKAGRLEHKATTSLDTVAAQLAARRRRLRAKGIV